MANEHSEVKNGRDVVGRFKVKLKPPVESDAQAAAPVYLISTGSPEGVTCSWSTTGVPVEFYGDWTNPSTWQITNGGRTKCKFHALDVSTTGPGNLVRYKVHLTSADRDMNWQLLEPAGGGGYKLPYVWDGRTMYLSTILPRAWDQLVLTLDGSEVATVEKEDLPPATCD